MPCATCGAAHACPLQQMKLQPGQHSSMPRGRHGILNVNKPAGMTSHDVVSVVRKFSREKRVGHAGTLDPMAMGVLIVCMGNATRVAEYLVAHDKKYCARVRLGIETDTYDATGQAVAQREVTATREQIESTLHSFVGKQAQLPPAYSAIKQDGVPLYKLARKGVAVETEARAVEIFSIDVREVALPDVEFDVHCSKGTYIRSLAHDLGERLGCGAHLTALTRTASGDFTLDDAVTLDQLREAFAGGCAEKYLHPLDDALLQFEAVIVDPATATRLQQGNMLNCGREYTTPLLRVYSTDGNFVALLERGAAADVWKPKKVFRI